jgi:ribosomal protein S18 acetylase RimI-like enzyme
MTEVFEGILIRPATFADSDWLYALNERTMRDYVVATFGSWKDALQAQMHDVWFDPARVQIVEVDGKAIGVLDVEDRDECIYVRRVEVAPEWQRRGIGSTVLRDVMSRGRPVLLHVFVVNREARKLYERLGFEAIPAHGHRFLMRYPPA